MILDCVRPRLDLHNNFTNRAESAAAILRTPFDNGKRLTSESATVFLVDPDPAAQGQAINVAGSLRRPIEISSSAEEFLDRFAPDRAGCIVSELCLPDGSGVELLKAIRSTGSAIPLLFLTSGGKLASAVEAMRAGALDVLEKPVSENVFAGIVEQSIQRDARNRYRRNQERGCAERLRHLTPRQRQVMNLMVEGLSSKQIAARLGLSVKTIDAHRAGLMHKMGAGNLVQLIHIVTSATYANEWSNPKGGLA